MAAAPAPTYESIVKSLADKRFAPVYLLHGEEGYYIDELARRFEDILTDDEKAFNLYVVHAPDTEPARIIDLCRRLPMMAERQVVILKEAQAIRADQLNKLASYVAAPAPGTILVICCRGTTAKGKDLLPALKKGGSVIFESKKVAEYNAPALIGNYIKSKGLSAGQKALQMLVDFIGTDLSRLFNEIDKLATLLPERAEVTPEVIERHIGVSREYNSFELVDAIAARDAARTFRIIAYFRANPKAVPLVMAAASVFNFFADLLQAYYAPDRSDAGITTELKLRNQFALRRIKLGMSRYTAAQVVEIISAIRAYDVASKGVGSRQTDQQLFYDLMYHILSATGRL